MCPSRLARPSPVDTLRSSTIKVWISHRLAYLGDVLLRSPRYALFAYGLIFASFAHLRFIQNLTGRGDELLLARQWFGVTNPAIVAAIVFLIGLPPVIAADRF